MKHSVARIAQQSRRVALVRRGGGRALQAVRSVALIERDGEEVAGMRQRAGRRGRARARARAEAKRQRNGV